MNEQLEDLENQLQEMPAKKRNFIYVSIIALLVFMSWSLFGEDMSLEIDSKVESVESLQTKLQKNSTRSLEKAIKNTKTKTLILEEELTNLHFKNQFVIAKLESVKFIFSDEMGLAKILDDILKESLRESIDINYVSTIEKNERETSHVIKKEIFTINGSGSFNNIMNLVQHIDSLNALLKVSNFKIYIDEEDNTNFDLNVSNYGVNL
ncbi:MAG: hypothetical protein U9N39_00895 [Campylobacterota bacterium]|nr:hypothetical protein [Campylobacterota bacterium]